MLVVTAMLLYVLIGFVSAVTGAQAQEISVAQIPLTENEKLWLKNNAEVVVGFIPDLPPALIVAEDGNHKGIVPEMLALFSERTGVNFRFKIFPTWKEAIKAGAKREIDIVGVGTERLQYRGLYDFTPPYVKTYYYIFAQPSLQEPGQLHYGINDLIGKKVGYIDSYQQVEALAERRPDIRFVSYPQRNALVNALVSGDVDFVLDLGVLEYWRKKNKLDSFRMYGVVPDLYADAVMLIRRDWPELASIMHKVFASTAAERQEILGRWLGTGNSLIQIPDSPNFTEAEKVWLAEHPVLRVGYDPSWAPIEFADREGRPQGLSFEYMQRLEKLLGVRFEYTPSTSWTIAQTKLVNAEVDLLPAASSTRTRQQRFNFTSPYLSFPIGIFSAGDKAYLGGLDALKGERVVVVENYAIQEWLQEDHPALDVVTAPTLEAALELLAEGDAYAFVGNLVSTSYYVGQSGLTQIRAVGETAYRNDLGIAVRKDWPMLVTILQKGLDAISVHDKERIYAKWNAIRLRSTDYTLLWQVIAVTSLLLFVILYWNRRLSAEIAYRRNVEAELHLAKQEAEQAAQVKSTLLANVSHELRTPMNVVIGMNHLMQETSLTEQQQEYMWRMQISAETLLETIDGILDFSRAEVGKQKVDRVLFELDNTLQKVRHMLEFSTRQKQLELVITVDPDVPAKLVGDPNKLAQILRNLGSNAIKFTEQGEVGIEVSLLGIREHDVRLNFAVKDTGIGISLKQQKKLFLPFSQVDTSTSRSYGGTGLGLVICKQMVELMGGSIAVESEPGQGSTFSFTLDFGIGQGNELQLELPATPGTRHFQISPQLAGSRMLVVEDDAMNQFYMRELMSGTGVEMQIAANGKEALQCLNEQSFDVVFMDIQMPELDGYATTRIFRQQETGSRLPIIALTAHALPGERAKCIAVGMDDYMSKPLNPYELNDMLLKWVKPGRGL